MKIENIKPYEKNAKKHPKKQKVFKCINCGKEWKDYISNDRNKKFCSIKCKSDYARVNRVCKKCGKVFTICKSVLIDSNSSGNYCSLNCYYSSMRTGLIKSKNGFRGIVHRNFPKPQVCSRCGKSTGIHIHHIEPFRYTYNNDLSNLIPLCNSCHKIVEIMTETLLKIDPIQSRVFNIMRNILRDRQQHTYYLCK